MRLEGNEDAGAEGTERDSERCGTGEQLSSSSGTQLVEWIGKASKASDGNKAGEGKSVARLSMVDGAPTVSTALGASAETNPYGSSLSTLNIKPLLSAGPDIKSKSLISSRGEGTAAALSAFFFFLRRRNRT
jgi:hypothetical protein